MDDLQSANMLARKNIIILCSILFVVLIRKQRIICSLNATLLLSWWMTLCLAPNVSYSNPLSCSCWRPFLKHLNFLSKISIGFTQFFLPSLLYLEREIKRRSNNSISCHSTLKLLISKAIMAKLVKWKCSSWLASSWSSCDHLFGDDDWYQ